MSYGRTQEAGSSNSPFEYREKLVCVRRTSKARGGGRDFSFSATVVVGDGNGKVGCGSGTAKDVPVAIRKATESAKCSMVDINLSNKTLQHSVSGRFGATKVFMRPASEGTGIIAGGAMRAVFEVLGVENVLAKCVKSSNPFNVVKATIAGLQSMIDPLEVSRRRGVAVSEVFITPELKTGE
ncbi:MAG: 30S ribosomal protein S5 [Pseudomonadota bacterium]|nr:30S ribosomal protein S5 [Pseudomonadota bacterium]